MADANGATAASKTIFSVGSGSPVVYTPVAKVADIDGPKIQQDTTETTTYDSDSFKEFEGTLKSGQVDLQLIWTGAESQEPLLTGFLSAPNTKIACQIEYPAGFASSRKWQFAAIVTKVDFKAPVKDVYKANVSLQITGAFNLA